MGKIYVDPDARARLFQPPPPKPIPSPDGSMPSNYNSRKKYSAQFGDVVRSFEGEQC